jgi:dTDP-4-dehydrorhamnose reductase
VAEALAREAPDVVLNCIGIIKQRPQSDDPATSIALNALFPHLLADACGDLGARLITFGTDCVFKGDRGGYTEDDHGDANDLYGRTKLLGELRDRTNALTLRTSIVGRELTTFQSLIEWLISQEGRTISGYRKAIFTGLTTNQVANVVGRLIVDAPDLQGLFHLAGPVISKHDLLAVVRDALGLNIEIEADDEFVIDRSLDGSRFVEATGIESPSWESMIAEMAADPTPYHLWR